MNMGVHLVEGNNSCISTSRRNKVGMALQKVMKQGGMSMHDVLTITCIQYQGYSVATLRAMPTPFYAVHLGPQV